MKSFEKDLQKYAEKIRLKVSERHELRERILSYMEYHPLPKQGLLRAELEHAIQTEPFTVFSFSWYHARIAGGVLGVFLILAPFIAERAMPGDMLYIVKTNFNETIQKQLVDSPYEKIEFETKILERRITEARTLASEGKLTEEAKMQITDDVRKSTMAVQSGIEELKVADAEGAAIAQIAFNASLEVQSAILDADTSIENDSLIEGIRIVVNEARDEVASNQVENKPSFEGLMAKVELQTTRAYELFSAVKEGATPEEIADIERRLSDVNRLIGEAKEKHENSTPVIVAAEEAPEGETQTTLAPIVDVVGVPADAEQKEDEAAIATEDLANTLKLLQKLIMFMTDINVRETIALETLVPVVLSDAERIEIVQKGVASVRETTLEVSSRLEFIGDAGVKEKIEEALVRIGILASSTSKALITEDIDGAEVALTEARALADDISALSQYRGRGTPGEEITPDEVPDILETASSTEEVAILPALVPEF